MGADRARAAFVVAAAAIACLAAGWVAWAPLGASIVAVFLFAGPHNWLEARFFLSQMPARWGPLRAYFLIGIGGVVALTAGFIAIPIVARAQNWRPESWSAASSTWHTFVLLWLATLVYLRGRQQNAVTPRRDWTWAFPAALVLIAAAWMFPQPWDLLLVYLHPIIALWFLDLTLRRRKPAWVSAYRGVLCAVPVLLACVWVIHLRSPALVGQDMLTMRITHHAGADAIASIPPQVLVATHVLLEILHYAVWVIAIPLITLGPSAVVSLERIPLARAGAGWRWGVVGMMTAGLVVVLVLWAGFLVNYPLTRDVYFAVAVAHVLAEAPFLLRQI